MSVIQTSPPGPARWANASARSPLPRRHVQHARARARPLIASAKRFHSAVQAERHEVVHQVVAGRPRRTRARPRRPFVLGTSGSRSGSGLHASSTVPTLQARGSLPVGPASRPARRGSPTSRCRCRGRRRSGCTAYEPTGSIALMLTSRLPTCSTSWPGPWPRTSAEGENTRRYSYGSGSCARRKRDVEHARNLVQRDLGRNALDHSSTRSMPPPLALATNSGIQFAPSRCRAISTTM